MEVCIGLGSNVDGPARHVKRAFDELADLPSTVLVRRSALYRTKPCGPRNQPDYVNAAALLKTALPPLAMLAHLHTLERRHGRVRLRKWGPRTLDLDILLYGRIVYRHPRLTIPHPLMHKRAFVLIPLSEIAPELLIPGKGRVVDLARRLQQSRSGSVRRMEQSQTRRQTPTLLP